MVKPKITEKEFMAQVIQLAKLCGWMVYHTHDSRHSCAGFPDLVLLRRGVLIVAELKIGDKQPTTLQQDWLREFARANVNSFCWRPDDWPTIEAFLKG